MIDKKYHLKFLGLFKEDLNEIVDYIVDELKNPEAAKALVDEIERAVM